MGWGVRVKVAIGAEAVSVNRPKDTTTPVANQQTVPSSKEQCWLLGAGIALGANTLLGSLTTMDFKSTLETAFDCGP